MNTRSPMTPLCGAKLQRRVMPKGFTLLEIGITLLLLGGLLAIAVPAVNTLSGAYVRQTVSRLQGLCRDTYARTALSGNAHRIVFDIDMGAYWVERTEGGVVMRRNKLELTNEGVALLDVIDERIADIGDSTDEQDMEKRKVYSGPTWQPVEGEEGKPQKLHPDVRFYAIWADHLSERAHKGKVAVHFFPGGYAQEAQITIADNPDGDGALTLVLQPLTGETYVEDGLVDLPL